MFRNFPRRNDRKARISSWFALERDGDMQSFDVHGPVSGARLYVAAVLRERAARRSARAAGTA